jgi:predicted aspartyl protease
MGRIVAHVRVANAIEQGRRISFSGLVDTGAAYLTLPSAWKPQLEPFPSMQMVDVETAAQETVQGEVCGPVRIEIEGFRPIYSEVLFIGVHPEDGVYEPLVGYLPLEQSQAVVDMLGHRLVHARRIDLK